MLTLHTWQHHNVSSEVVRYIFWKLYKFSIPSIVLHLKAFQKSLINMHMIVSQKRLQMTNNASNLNCFTYKKIKLIIKKIQMFHFKKTSLVNYECSFSFRNKNWRVSAFFQNRCNKKDIRHYSFQIITLYNTTLLCPGCYIRS